MAFRIGLTIGVGVLALAAATQASATVEVVDFTVSPPWFDYEGANPFGVPAQPTLTGSITVDNTRSDATAFVWLNYVTGSRTWTLADIGSGSSVDYNTNGTVSNFDIEFTAVQNYVISNNTVQINDDNGNSEYCNNCVSLGRTVPEPATWAMMILGMGAMGAVLRRRRSGALAAA